MKIKTPIVQYSLVGALAVGAISAASGAVRVSHSARSYADMYNQVNRFNNTPASISEAIDNLPVRVADTNLAQQIATNMPNTPVTKEDLERCAAIYPNGEFAWDTPTMGNRVGSDARCVAVVRMVAYHAAKDGSNLVLATANVSAGDTIKCNISEFPVSSYTPGAGTIVFPADNAPTIEDVTKIMNEEQKQNAALKIIAGTAITALAGNAVMPNEPGEDGVLGIGRKKIGGTVGGAAIGAAVTSASVYSGKVAGDMIMSAGVNMAAGAAMGNMMASGKTMLRIEDCVYPDKVTTTKKKDKSADDDDNKHCLWGIVNMGKVIGDGKAELTDVFYNYTLGTAIKCTDIGEDKEKCTSIRLTNVVTKAEYDYKIQNPSIKTITESVRDTIYTNIQKNPDEYIMCLVDGRIKEHKYAEHCDAPYTKIVSAREVSGASTAALIELTDDDYKELSKIANKRNGSAENIWTKWQSKNTGKTILGRNSSGAGYKLGAKGKEVRKDENGDTVKDDSGKEIEDPVEWTVADFTPMYVDSGDGALIDITNKGRAKETAVGAGAGAALGAFTAYQGAQQEIQDRWIAADREYKDSLQKIFCETGTKWLSNYNDTVIIPAMATE